jgi:hypothetical protein
LRSLDPSKTIRIHRYLTDWNVVKHHTFAPRLSTLDLPAGDLIEIMLFEAMTTETAGAGPDSFAVESLFIPPVDVKTVFARLPDSGFELFILFFIHHLASICVTNDAI